MNEAFGLVKQMFNLLKQRGLYLCTAESCTGGLLGHLITNLPDASDFYLGGQVTYSNTAKQHWLGISSATLEQYGAVSKETVLEMARGIRSVIAHDLSRENIIGVSISGIAGPSGGTLLKPVGTVWIGLSIADQEKAMQFHFSGDREAIKEQSANRALEVLILALKSK